MPRCRRRTAGTSWSPSTAPGFSHKFLEHLDTLAARRGHTLIYSCGWELAEREKAALRLVPEGAWEIAVDHRGEVRERRADGACEDTGCGHRACWIAEAHVTELTGLLRKGPSGDQLSGWPATMRLFARRERPHLLDGTEDSYEFGLFAAVIVPMGNLTRRLGRRRHRADHRLGAL